MLFRSAAVPADLDPTSTEVRINAISVDPVLGWVMTYPFNVLSRCPVMRVPSGRADTGVPTGIQIVGRSSDAASVFRAGAAYAPAGGGQTGLRADGDRAAGRFGGAVGRTANSGAPGADQAPTGDDDDVVARQLREAAEKETDPVMKEKLWEEYKKYKAG